MIAGGAGRGESAVREVSSGGDRAKDQAAGSPDRGWGPEGVSDNSGRKSDTPGYLLLCYVWAVFAAAVLYGVWLHLGMS